MDLFQSVQAAQLTWTFDIAAATNALFLIKQTSRLPLLKTFIGQRCFSYRGARLCNKLGAVIETAQTLHQFKAAYEAWSNI